MADKQVIVSVDTQRDTTQQLTASTPATKPTKNLRWVSAGKLTAQKTHLACKAQKRRAEEAEAKMAANKKKVTAQAVVLRRRTVTLQVSYLPHSG